MSNHSIGAGLDQVAKEVITLYENQKITKDVAIRLINTCRMSVHVADGNEYEAVDSVVNEGYCGLCFKKKKELTNIYETNLSYHLLDKIWRRYDDTAAHFFLCPECTEQVFGPFLTEEKLVEPD